MESMLESKVSQERSSEPRDEKSAAEAPIRKIRPVTPRCIFPAFSSVWQYPIVPPPLTEGVVHLWSASLDLSSDQVESLGAMLSASEQNRSSRLRLPLLRNRAIVTRATLRLLLGHYLKLAPEAVSLTTSLHGKPELSDDAVLRFNLSHSGGLAIYALTLKQAIGIDIEQIRPTPYALSIAQRHWTKDEVQALEIYAATGEGNLEAGFLTCWTRKEAWLKAIGMGLHRPMDSFQVSGPGTPPRLLATEEGSEETRRWWMESFTPAAGYTGTVVVEGQEPHA